MTMHHSISEGIYLIDTHLGHQIGSTSAYMLESDGHVAFFDSGASYSVPYFLQALTMHHLSPDQVKYIFISHIHLDHFAGASHLLKYCKNALIIVHERGFKHCQNPTKLIESAANVYGGINILEREFGIPEEININKLRIADYSSPIKLGKKRLHLMDTPGHAMHHYVLFDAQTSTVLSADAFGLSYPCHLINDSSFIVPTTSPNQFDPEQMTMTIDKILALNPLKIAVAHFNVIHMNTTKKSAILSIKSMIYRFAHIAHIYKTDIDAIEAALWGIILDEFRLQGGRLPESQTRARFSLDVQLNAQGLRDYYVRINK